jgi:UDP-N-acetylenolpyruvoylglucosamine reductase
VFVRVEQAAKLDSSLRELRRQEGVEIHERVDLRAWTVLGVGGLASLVVRCHSSISVQTVLDFSAAHGLRWVTLGAGSRLIPPDRGIQVPVLNLTGELGRWEVELDGLVSGAGANLAQVCRAGVRGGLSGLEFLGTRTHTIGGVVSAAARGILELRGLLDWVEIRRPGGDPDRWTADELEKVPDPAALRRRVMTRMRFRLRPTALASARPSPMTPPRGRNTRSAAPVFIDARDATAADLLHEAGCASLAVGGARFGGTDANELIAGRSATSSEVLDLCRRARDRVFDVTGIELVPALTFVDEQGEELRP